MKSIKRILSAVIACLLSALSLVGCIGVSEPEYVAPTVPENYQWASYQTSEDAPFTPTNIFSTGEFVPGFVTGEVDDGYLEKTDQADTGVYLFNAEYGKCYVMKIPAGTKRAFVGITDEDPRQTAVGEKLYLFDIQCDKENLTEQTEFMYVCRMQSATLLLYTDSKDPIYIDERTILQDTDIDDQWYVPEPVGDIMGEEGSWGNQKWTSDEVINHLYEPVRQRHPDYITREVIGKDETGTYDMYGYVYAPENYEATIFLASGVHGDEKTTFFALAKVMQMIADAEPEDNLLFTLRHKVRFVVIPIVNVWSVSTAQVRTNSTGMDLNRDFKELTQQESKNVIAYFGKFAEEIDVMMDLHVTIAKSSNLWFNFINCADNAVVNYKTTNHLYHRYMELGCMGKNPNMQHIPGGYGVNNDSKYLDGRIWNEFGVPAMTVEYAANTSFPGAYNSAGMTLAVETELNFIIQNALYFMAQK